MAKFIFNNKNYNIDDSAIATAMTALESHLSSMAGGAEPDYPVASQGLAFTLKDDGTYEVSGIGQCTDTDIIIAPVHQGLPVTSIGDKAFNECSNLTRVVIPNSVTRIGQRAFRSCSSLTSVEMGDSVIWITNWAFQYCTNLTNIVIPNSVTSIGQEAFSNCSSLTSIIIPDEVTSIGYKAFNNCTKLTILCEAESQPSGWNVNWNFSNIPVTWGYAPEN